MDKGGLDALMGEDTEGADAAGAKLLAEVARLLRPQKGSVYICVSLAQAHVLSTDPLPAYQSTACCGALSVLLSLVHYPPFASANKISASIPAVPAYICSENAQEGLT